MSFISNKSLSDAINVLSRSAALERETQPAIKLNCSSRKYYFYTPVPEPENARIPSANVESSGHCRCLFLQYCCSLFPRSSKCSTEMAGATSWWGSRQYSSNCSKIGCDFCEAGFEDGIGCCSEIS